MYTYTTPTLQIRITGVDFSNAQKVEITIKQHTKDSDKKMVITDAERDGDTFTKVLTQEQSAEFKKGPVTIQARILTIIGDVIPTNKAVVPWEEVLNEEVLV